MTDVQVPPDSTVDYQQLLEQSSRADPYPLLARLREASPALVRPGLVVVARFADCQQVLRSPLASSDRSRATLAPDGRGPRTRNFLHLDAPDHTRLRRLVSRAFTPRVVAALEPTIRHFVDERLTAAAGRGRMDVVAELAYPLPTHVICQLLGVPESDYPVFHEWSVVLTHSLEPPLPGMAEQHTPAQARRAGRDFVNYFRGLIADRRVRPQDDLLSYLVAVEEEGDQLTESELLATCALLLAGGHETAVGMISNGLLALLRHPEQYAAVAADPALAGGAVDEVLRYDPAVQLTGRVATAPLAIGRFEAQPGDLLMVLLAAANRDPAVYPDPDLFDIRRGVTNHLAFAAGPHFCLGASLARLEGTLAFQAFVRRVVNPRLAAEPTYRPNLNLRGPQELWLDFDGIRPAG
jgi:cytochrome P450